MKVEIRPYADEAQATPLKFVHVNGQVIIEVPAFGLLTVGVIDGKIAAMIYQPKTRTEKWREVAVFEDHLEIELLDHGPRLQVYLTDLLITEPE
jgi:hypothetical protein